MRKYLFYLFPISVFYISFLWFFVLKNNYTPEKENSVSVNKINVEKINDEKQVSANDNEQQTDVCKDDADYKRYGACPMKVGKTIIRDIDGDGKIEKVVRFDSAMADRIVQELLIYRNISGKYRIIKTFYGDPYGFARMNDDNTIIVGKYLPIEIIEGGPLRNWDDFDHFQIIKYKWTKNGEIKVSEEIIENSSFKDFSEEIKNYFLD